MDIEQLKLILETVGAAGDGAFTLAMIYFALGLLKSFLAPGAFIVVVAIIAKAIIHSVDKCQAFDVKKAEASKRAELEFYHTRYPELSQSDAKEAFARVRKSIENPPG